MIRSICCLRFLLQLLYFFFNLLSLNDLIYIVGLTGELLSRQCPQSIVEELSSMEHILGIVDEDATLIHKILKVFGFFAEAQQQEEEQCIFKPFLFVVPLEF